MIIKADCINRLLHNIVTIHVSSQRPGSPLSGIWKPLMSLWDPVSLMRTGAAKSVLNDLGKFISIFVSCMS